MFDECIWLKEFMIATCSRLEEGEEERGSCLIWEGRTDCKNPLPLLSHFGYYNTVLVLEIHGFFFCSWKKKKKERIFQCNCEKELSFSSLCNLRVHCAQAAWECPSHENTCSGVIREARLWSWARSYVCSEKLGNFTTKYLSGCPSTDSRIPVTCCCHRGGRCDSSGFSTLAKESLSFKIRLQVFCVSRT